MNTEITLRSNLVFVKNPQLFKKVIENTGIEVDIKDANKTVVMYSYDEPFNDDLIAVKHKVTGEYVTGGCAYYDFEEMLDDEGISDYENYEEVPLTTFIQEQLEDDQVLVIRENANEGVRWLYSGAALISKNEIKYLNFDQICEEEAKMKGVL